MSTLMTRSSSMTSCPVLRCLAPRLPVLSVGFGSVFGSMPLGRIVGRPVTPLSPPRANPPPPASARRSPPAGVRSGPQGRHATALKGGSSREPTCLEQIGSAMSKGNLAHHHTCPAFCPRYSSVRLDFPCCKNQPQKSELLQ